ncbi:hypothetical protein FHX75_121569 [Micromonospora palomenae]|uniref:Uncharacterized protein n=1 Tax=Micromonospora palomenae TaxID=1461247 RepID=A0A561WGM2_9ACTN|nr:hypothetical protein FHX75_121569 [Micromonospora palomenae]
MPDVSAIARERAALTTIADAIVAASVGRGLRVALDCPNTHLALVDYLAQALHARGRACHCQPNEPSPDDAGGSPRDRQEHGSTIVVITSGLATETDRFAQRINISVTAPTTKAPGGNAGYQETGGAPSEESGEPHIILDYRDPDGPTIRYMASHLRTGDGQ